MTVYNQNALLPSGGMSDVNTGILGNISHANTGLQVPKQNTGIGDQTKAGLIGAGVEAGTAVLGGVLQGAQTKRLREQSEAQNTEQLAKARIEREKDKDLLRQQDQHAKRQARYQQLQANTGLRLQMFQRDIQKQAQKFNDAQSALNTIRQSAVGGEVMKDMFAQTIRRA